MHLAPISVPLPPLPDNTYLYPWSLAVPTSARCTEREAEGYPRRRKLRGLHCSGESTEVLTLLPHEPISSCHPRGSFGACAASMWKSCKPSSICTPSWSKLLSPHSTRNSSALKSRPPRGCPSDLEEGLLSCPEPAGPPPWILPPPSAFSFPVTLEGGPTCSLGLSKC